MYVIFSGHGCLPLICQKLVFVISQSNRARDLTFAQIILRVQDKKEFIWAPGDTTYMQETCFFDHISQTNKARDLIFGTDTPVDPGENRF